jgi:hypothetical protein
MRITDKDLSTMFERFVNAAHNARKDTAGLVFGQLTGVSYYVGQRRDNVGPVWQVSPYWSTKREAYAGLDAMACALEMETEG